MMAGDDVLQILQLGPMEKYGTLDIILIFIHFHDDPSECMKYWRKVREPPSIWYRFSHSASGFCTNAGTAFGYTVPRHLVSDSSFEYVTYILWH